MDSASNIYNHGMQSASGARDLSKSRVSVRSTMQSSDINNGQSQVQKLMKTFASTKNTPGSITTSKLGQKAKNLQNKNNVQSSNNNGIVSG